MKFNQHTTFTIIKPDAFEKKYTGLILDHIARSGFAIVAMRLVRLSQREAKAFYSVHSAAPFFDELISFMTSGPCVVAVLEKENAVNAFRELIGATDPLKAAEGTIRKLYAESIGKNAIHGSDSPENAQIEGQFFFATRDSG